MDNLPGISQSDFQLFIDENLYGPYDNGWGIIDLGIWGSRKWTEQMLVAEWTKPYSRETFIWDVFLWNLAIKTVFYYRPSQYLYIKHYCDYTKAFPRVHFLFGWKRNPQRVKHLVDVSPECSGATGFNSDSLQQMSVIADRFFLLLDQLDVKACLGKLDTSAWLPQATKHYFFLEEFSQDPPSLSYHFLSTLNHKLHS